MTQEEWKDNLTLRMSKLEVDLKSVEVKLAELTTKNAVEEVHRENVDKRLESIEGNLKWLVRLILGAIILGMVGFLIAGGFSV